MGKEKRKNGTPVTGSGALSAQAHMELIRKERKSNNAWNKFRRNKAAVAGLIIVTIMVCMGIFADFIAPFPPNEINYTEYLLKPGVNGHILGTDEFGRDLLSRIIFGARTSVIIAVGSTLLGGFIGIVVGLVSGYAGGVIDSLFMRIIDGMFAFPYILLSIFLATILGSGVFNVILALGIGAIPRFARTVRGEVLRLKNEEYCNAERVLGASHLRIIFRHIFPNALSPIIVFSTLNVASAIISEAALSFLGLGILTPTASWGNILEGGKNCLNTAPHIATASGIFILVTVIGFNLLGDGIRDVMDPKMKQ